MCIRPVLGSDALADHHSLDDHVGGMLWRADQHEVLTERAWDAALARDAIRAIVSDAEAAANGGLWPGHPLDDLGAGEFLCSLYLGSAGMIWALWKLGSAFDSGAAVTAAIGRYRARPDFGPQAHPPSPLMGETGLLVVAEKIGSSAVDPRRLSELMRDNRQHPSWELMWGSPGTMLAARACGLDDEWRDSAELLYAPWDERSDVWTHHLHGKVQPSLGPVHGFAGNVHALRGFVDDELLRVRVTRLLTRTAGRKHGLVNWPPTDRPPGESASTIKRICLPQAARPHRRRSTLARTRPPLRDARDRPGAQRAELGRGRYTLWTGDVGVALYVQACLDAVSDFPASTRFRQATVSGPPRDGLRDVDTRPASRENRLVLQPGLARKQIAHTLNAAYADGLLSEDTFAHRLDQLLKARLIDPRRLVGDLYLRPSGRGLSSRLADDLRAAIMRLKSFLSGRRDERWVFLALDWSGEQRELLIGRHSGCDVVLSDPCVSRRHARLFFRDGGWYLQDLESTNGTVLNGVRIGRCHLRPGDRLVVGDEHLQID